MSETNSTSSGSSCTLIHAGPAGSQRAPLFLLHDGGGTIFHYFLLKPLNRAVYGIQNSRVQPGQDWEGGIPEMAAEYLDAIKKVVQRRPILVGGWSLGGLVALEMSRLVADHPLSNPRILGLIMIDSVFPHPRTLSSPPIIRSVPFQVDFDEHVRPDVRAMVQYAMAQTDVLIEKWDLPSWTAEDRQLKKLVPPPAIMLRAREAAPEPEQTDGEGVLLVNDIDVCRKRRFLGWEEYETKFIRNVLDVNGHHHSIFEVRNIASVDAKLKIACKSLDPGL